jgi:TPR repeat protein
MLQTDDTRRRLTQLILGGLLVTGVIAVMAVRAGGVPPGSEVNWLNELAVSGDAGAELQLGLAYRDGLYGLTPDLQASLKWLTEAARHGDAYAADAVANAYDRGLGVAVDQQQAVNWWENAARGGNTDARQQLGEYLVTKNQYPQAVHWLRLAAAAGDVRARNDLARLYREHTLPESDLPDADTQRGENPFEVLGTELDSPGLESLYTLWDAMETDAPLLQSRDRLKERAARGDPLAEYQLGLRYLDGAWAVRRNPDKAREWLERASAAGNRNATSVLQQLQSGSPPGSTGQAVQAVTINSR